MTAEPDRLLEQWLAAADAGQIEAFDDFLHGDVVVYAPLGLSSKGLAEEKAVWRAALEAMPDLRHEVQEVVSQGSSTAARVVVTGTLVRTFAGVAATGRPFRLDQVVFAHVRDGKAEEVWEIADVGVLLRDPDGPPGAPRR